MRAAMMLRLRPNARQRLKHNANNRRPRQKKLVVVRRRMLTASVKKKRNFASNKKRQNVLNSKGCAKMLFNSNRKRQ